MLHFKALLLIRKEALFVSLELGRCIDAQRLSVYVTFLPGNPEESEWTAEQDQSLQLILAYIQEALPLDSYAIVYSMCFKSLWLDRMLKGACENP